ncbi:uncharacterized protein BX664DRAFT_327569 [Halteromyces radiatus]|uniref:uncharacterized protein n=1 Tax=Halteromyces radiatus TaxID=101107 RepID=UPI00221EA473|nr:uncharacterized protein BX664DRAFT_327569 [Halteromyces radiatus]KAI8092550.1 hypothetical protein BX664DRAFT_327569 [Halteromyces radiatus]
MRPTKVMPVDERYVCLNTTLPIMNATWTSLRKGDKRTPLGLLDPIFDVASPGIQNTSCSLQDICGMSGFANASVPDQTFRFFTPLFLHTGALHLLIDGALHWFVAKDLERVMNPIRFAGVYILSGLFGNAFGSNFAIPTNPFMGCGPSLFALCGCSLIDIIFMWRLIGQPVRHMIKIVVFIAAGFVLGLLPGVDNFTHLGGLISGLLIGLISMPAIYYSRRYQITLIFCRCLAFALYMGLSVLFWSDFYSGDDPGESCAFCRYVSCLPIGGFCD